MAAVCRCGHAESEHFDGLGECEVCECERFEEGEGPIEVLRLDNHAEEELISKIGDWRWGYGWDRPEKVSAPPGVSVDSIIETRKRRCRSLLDSLRPGS